MRFLVDESVGKKFSDILKNSGKDVLFVGDSGPEVDDENVLSFANNENRVLITADKDFGELIFKLGISSTGVILLRTLTTDAERRFDMIKDTLEKAKGKFVVIKEGQIRVRDLK